jgi:hypothetical protein
MTKTSKKDSEVAGVTFRFTLHTATRFGQDVLEFGLFHHAAVATPGDRTELVRLYVQRPLCPISLILRRKLAENFRAYGADRLRANDALQNR